MVNRNFIYIFVKKMNIQTIKNITFEDYQLRLKNVLSDAVMMEKEETGLYLRILKTDRFLLYQAMGEILDVSQMGQNRDELSFFESLHHLFHYYMYDDGTLEIKWQKYSIKKGKFIKCKENDKRGKPYLTTKSDDCDGNPVAREKEIHWLLDWYDADLKKRKQEMIDAWGEDDEDVKCYDKKEFIDYD